MDSSKVFVSLAIIEFLVIGAKTDFNTNLESLYSAHQQIEDIVMNDPKLAFKLKQAFFPSMNYRYWQVDGPGVDVIPFHICVSCSELSSLMNSINTTTIVTSGEELTADALCWDFQWTNSLLISLIPGDLLLAMDSTLTIALYSEIIKSSNNRLVRLFLQFDNSSQFCQSSADDLEQAVAFSLSMVSGNQ